MPRPREFDEDQVIAQAMDVFWSRGYEATSITDLMEATGLAKGSIYKGFGDKRSFFLRALGRYLDEGTNDMCALLDAAATPEQGLRRWLHSIVELATHKGERRGCFGVNCAIELAPHDPEIRALIRSHQARAQRRVAATIAQGIAKGTFAESLDPDIGARSLVTLVNGLQVSGKLGMTRAEALANVELALNALR